MESKKGPVRLAHLSHPSTCNHSCEVLYVSWDCKEAVVCFETLEADKKPESIIWYHILTSHARPMYSLMKSSIHTCILYLRSHAGFVVTGPTMRSEGSNILLWLELWPTTGQREWERETPRQTERERELFKPCGYISPEPSTALQLH